MVDAARGMQIGHHASQGMDEPTLAMTGLSTRYRRWRNSQGAGNSSTNSSSATNSAGSNSSSSAAASSDSMFIWDSVPEELVILCWPAIVGFSFSAKSWGHVLVSGLEDIEFRENAFDQLVLPTDRKQLIKALVRFGGEGNTGKCCVHVCLKKLLIQFCFVIQF